MADTLERILPAFLGNVAADIFTVPASKKWIVSAVILANGDTSQRTATLHHTSGGAAADANKIVPEVPIQAKKLVELGRGWIFKAGDKLIGLAEVANKITIAVHYVERPA